MKKEKSLDEWMTFISAQQKNSITRLHGIFRKQMEMTVLQEMEALGHPDFKIGQLVLLANIKNEGSISNDMAKHAQITKQAMNKVVHELKEKGYIFTEAHPSDRRALMIKFTERGKVFRYDLYCVVKRLRQNYEDVVGVSEMQQFQNTLEKLVNAGMKHLPAH
ncbi:MarR family winged helix-turn-helix transcriptional regulator [Persicobacter psychrovividus]|uniref:HTH marR-type domain-containing protein n=1 Tax=Persicobacter psychrovividus TaxID=387638 RepID=A0ABM7VCX8_9BACT|nr:hypothetical protein PEPS_10730 [Persicobacter psychrovividus]